MSARYAVNAGVMFSSTGTMAFSLTSVLNVTNLGNLGLGYATIMRRRRQEPASTDGGGLLSNW